MIRRHFPSDGVPRQSGMIAILTLGAVLLASVVSLGIVQAVLLHRQELERREQLAQVDLLAQAGFDRAAAILRNNSQTESIPLWEPEPAIAGDAAKVLYEWLPGEAAGRRRIQVTAELTLGPDQILRSRLQGEFSLPSD